MLCDGELENNRRDQLRVFSRHVDRALCIVYSRYIVYIFFLSAFSFVIVYCTLLIAIACFVLCMHVYMCT